MVRGVCEDDSKNTKEHSNNVLGFLPVHFSKTNR